GSLNRRATSATNPNFRSTSRTSTRPPSLLTCPPSKSTPIWRPFILENDSCSDSDFPIAQPWLFLLHLSDYQIVPGGAILLCEIFGLARSGGQCEGIQTMAVKH